MATRVKEEASESPDMAEHEKKAKTRMSESSASRCVSSAVLPDGEFCFVHPLVVTSASGIHVELPLCADVVTPGEVFRWLRLVESVCLAIYHQCYIGIGVVSMIGGHVPLDVVPGVGRELRAGY